MDRGISHASVRTAGRVTAITAMILSSVVVATGAGAQTLTDPNPKTASSPPLAATKPSPPPLNACSTYGAGFVQIPGTNTCVKVGVAVGAEATSHLGH
jgi:Porin subfamily